MSLATPTAAPTRLIQELATRAADFTAAKTEMRDLVDGLSDDQFNWRPDPDRWSMAECFDHLCMMGPLLVPRLDDGIRVAQEKGWQSAGPFKYGPIGNLFIKLSGPNSKRKFKAPGIFTPSSKHTVSRLVKTFSEMQDEYVQCVNRANGIDLARIKVANPSLPLFKLSLGQWFALLAGHQKRHYLQAAEVKKLIPDSLA